MLLIEDDEKLGELLQRVFREEGFDVTWCKGASAGLTAAAEPHDVVVLDWMLPDGDGIELCGTLRKRQDATPILMLTARGEVSDRVRGLDAGADDYVVKPFEIEELLARLHALTRRNRRATLLRFGELEIDSLRRRCTLAGEAVALTTREFDLMLEIALAAGEPVARSALLRDVWNLGFDPGSGLVEVHVSRLRAKLGKAANLIETVRGVGYRWGVRG